MQAELKQEDLLDIVPNQENIVKKTDSWKMFNRIAKRYDLLNRVLSFGQDILWRKKTLKYLPKKDDIRLLDVACGTADLLITHLKSKKIVHATGIDMAGEMLKIGQEKIDRLNLSEKANLILADGQSLPSENEQFDCVTIAFGIRNIPDYVKAISEMHRVLRSDGRVLILEFSLPSNFIIRNVYLFYFRNILPLVGSIVSGDPKAYRYLNKTVESFPYGDQFCKVMEQAGFKNVKGNKLSFGIATIYQGDK